MNQIYKVIWSRVKRCYVVVSEVAGRCGKNGAASEKESLPFRAFLCALAITGCLMPGVAEANTVHGPGAAATGSGSTAVGDNTKAKRKQCRCCWSFDKCGWGEFSCRRL